jgi:hypothetical protein
VEVHIGEVTSTVRATDGAAMLSPEILRQIVAAVREQLKSEHEHDRRVAEERKLTGGVSQGEGDHT